MPLIAYTGLPRSGKSYGVVEHVIEPAIKQGRDVWTNIPMKEDAWLERYGRAPTVFPIDDLMQQRNWFQEVLPAGVILVLDECWRVWPSGLKANNAIEAHQEFLTMHGHMVGDSGHITEIVLVTQDLAQLASFVRALVEFTYRSVKLRKLGMDKSFRVDVYEGCVTGPNPPIKKRISDQIYRYKPKTYDLYHSHTMSKQGAGIEQNLDKRSSMFSRRKAIWIGVLLLPLIVLMVKGFSSLADKYGLSDTVSPVPEDKPVAPAQVSDSAPASVPVSRPRHLDPLHGYDVYIVWSNGRSGHYDYQFMLQTRTEMAYVDQSDLYAMNYTLKAVNHCLALLSINNSTRTVTCRRPDSPTQTLIPVGDISG